MLVCVKFAYVAGGSAGREISKEEGNNRLAPSSTSVAAAVCGCDCARVSVDVPLVTLTSNVVGACRLEAVSVSNVINPRIELVITPKRASAQK